MRVLNFFNIKSLIIILFFVFLNNAAKSEEEKIESIVDQIQIITKDLKTLEQAVYKRSDVTSTSYSSNSLNEDVLTKHLLKLNEIEEQFRELTNRFEEINFKIDKLSNRVTKIQSDTQLRISDLEKVNSNNLIEGEQKKVSLPGTDKPQDFGAATGYQSTSNLPKTQQTQSIESAATVITEKAEQTESLLPVS